jgi:hypothetical protein
MGGGKWFAISVVMAAKEFLKRFLASVTPFQLQTDSIKGVPQEKV